MTKLKVGLIGYGFSGSTFHAPIITRVLSLILSKIVTTQPDKSTKDWPDVPTVREAEELFADKDIDMVVITSPNTTHFPLAMKALEAGKHVVIEKPFVLTVDEAEILLEKAKEHKRLLSVYHNRRWDNDFLTVKQIVKSGMLGELLTYEAHFDRYNPQVNQGKWRESNELGSGVLYDLGSHLIDQALHLFGMPERVSAELGKQRDGALADDFFHIILGYGKLKVILNAGMLVKEQGPRFQLHGTKGSFIKVGIDSQEEDLKQGKQPGSPGWGTDHEDHYGFLHTDLDGLEFKGRIKTLTGCYEAYYEGVADSILKGRRAPVTAEESRDTILIIEEVMRVSRMNHN